MKISELIAHLEDTKEKWGDAPCEVHYEQESGHKKNRLTHVIERPLLHMGVYLNDQGETVLALCHNVLWDEDEEQRNTGSDEYWKRKREG